MKAKQLAQVLRELEHDQHERAFEYIRAHGYQKLLGAVLRELQKEDKRKVILKTTKPVSEKTLSAIKKKHADYFVNTEPTNEVDENLIGGYILKSHQSRVDSSFRTQLLELYRKATTL